MLSACPLLGGLSSFRVSFIGGFTVSVDQFRENFSLLQINVGAVSICLIDDCVDHDVPLLDFSLADIRAEHNFSVVKKGRAKAMFAGDYYNRHISAWEPVLEPWM